MASFKHLLYQLRHVALYALLMAILAFVLKWLQWKLLIQANAIDLYIGLIAIFFTILGVWIATQLLKPKIQTVIVEKEVPLPDGSLNERELEKLKLSSREYEVLQLLTRGCSNAEIAESLFLSLSTVKTHVSNLFIKMEVKSRTQAIEKAKRLKITH